MSLGKKHKHIIPVPKTQLMRIVVGVLLILGGVLSFLPILGVWMLPLGLVYLSVDYKRFRRFKRSWEARLIKAYRNIKARYFN